MNKKDLVLVTIIGAAVGLLAEPTAWNLIHGAPALRDALSAGNSISAFRAALFLFFTALAPVALSIAHWLSKLLSPILYEIAKYCAVGALSTFMKFGIINLLSIMTGITSGPFVPVFAALGFVATMFNSFYWHKFWTFHATEPSGHREMARFWAVSIVTWFAYTGTVYVIVDFLRPAGMAPEVWLNVGALAGALVAGLCNFFGYRHIVFALSRAGSNEAVV